MQPLSAVQLLEVWEAGRHRHPVDRAMLLHALAVPDTPPERVADEPLGHRNAALLRLRLGTFGPRMRAYLDCEECGTRLEFGVDVAALLPEHDGVASVTVGGLAFRLPTSRDLAAIVDEVDVDRAGKRLLRRCLIEPDRRVDDATLESVLEDVEVALEESDPGAHVSVDVRCDVCGHRCDIPFDIVGILWEEVEARAARLLDEVHLLAHAYGWSESEILELSDTRRAAYLERVTS